MNKVFLMGRLVKDPELTTIASTGTAVCRFSMAVDRQFTRQGEERKSDFFNIVAWRNQAEFVKRYFTKGQRVAVVGRIENRQWDDQQGVKHYATDIIAEEVHFADGKRDSSASYGQPVSSGNNRDAGSGNDFAQSSQPGGGFFPIDEEEDMPF